VRARQGCVVVLCLLSSSGLSQTRSGTEKQASAADPGYAALAKRAEAARESGQIDQAVQLYKRLVALRPDSADNWWYLGMLNYEGDQYAEAISPFRKLTHLKPQMSLAWAMLGLCEFETKDYDAALVHLRHANELKIPDQQTFYEVSKYHLALLLIRHGEFEEASSVVGDFASRGTDTLQFKEAMGLVALRKPLLPNEIPPTEREMVLDAGTAVCDSLARRAERLSVDASELLSKYSEVPEVHYIVGTLFLNSDPDRAVEEWNKELHIVPGNIRALVSLVGEYMKRGDFQAAEKFAEQAVASNPDHYASHAVLGQTLSDGNLDVPRAIKELETAERMAPWQPQIRFSLASAYAKAGRKDDAAKQREAFLKLSGNGSATKPN
jgi:tetratricopeptide (TPR) repeat protein